jgi:hypothetical protein
MADIRYGIEIVNDPVRRAALNDWLALRIRPMFDGRILPITEEIMLKWRLLVEESRKSGHACSQPDLIIAATALHHGLSVVTRNTDDYARTGVTVFNPWMVTQPNGRFTAPPHTPPDRPSTSAG